MNFNMLGAMLVILSGIPVTLDYFGFVSISLDIIYWSAFGGLVAACASFTVALFRS